MTAPAGAFDTWNNSVAVCPACGREFEPDTECLEDDEVITETCDNCGADFEIEVTVSYLYATTLKLAGAAV